MGQALGLSQLGAVYLSHAEATRALSLYDQALVLFTDRAHVKGQATCHSGMGKARKLLGDTFMSELHAKEVTRLRAEAGGARRPRFFP